MTRSSSWRPSSAGPAPRRCGIPGQRAHEQHVHLQRPTQLAAAHDRGARLLRRPAQQGDHRGAVLRSGLLIERATLRARLHARPGADEARGDCVGWCSGSSRCRVRSPGAREDHGVGDPECEHERGGDERQPATVYDQDPSSNRIPRGAVGQPPPRLYEPRTTRSRSCEDQRVARRSGHGGEVSDA